MLCDKVAIVDDQNICLDIATCKKVRRIKAQKKRRKAREREKGGNPARYYRRKYNNAIGQKLSIKFDIHHLDNNWQNIEITNLVALPKDLHTSLHKYCSDLVYVNNQYYIPFNGKDHNYKFKKAIIDEVTRWIFYRNYRLGLEVMNLTGLHYD